ncbi:unnamed protein product [Pedinophyceae sp. YPF-701]|nr:unnamed protein product [Pedinophyceae sp. YPF-701]
MLAGIVTVDFSVPHAVEEVLVTQETRPVIRFHGRRAILWLREPAHGGHDAFDGDTDAFMPGDGDEPGEMVAEARWGSGHRSNATAFWEAVYVLQSRDNDRVRLEVAAAHPLRAKPGSSVSVPVEVWLLPGFFTAPPSVANGAGASDGHAGNAPNGDVPGQLLDSGTLQQRRAQTSQVRAARNLVAYLEAGEDGDQDMADADGGRQVGGDEGVLGMSDSEDEKDPAETVRDDVFAIIQPSGWMRASENPEGMRVPLYRYQRRALAWMEWRERQGTGDPDTQDGPSGGFAASMGQRGGGTAGPSSGSLLHALWEPVRLVGGAEVYVNMHTGEVSPTAVLRTNEVPGGILADEMGLGKSAEVIALMLSRPGPPCAPLGSAPSGAAAAEWDGPTLIVAPAAIVLQWEQEIEKFSNLKVLVYDGLESKNLDAKLKDFARELRDAGADGGGIYEPPPAVTPKRPRQKRMSYREALQRGPDPPHEASTRAELVRHSMKWMLDLQRMHRRVEGDSDPNAKVKRAELVAELMRRYDVVLTSFTVLSSEVHLQKCQRTFRRAKVYHPPECPLIQLRWWRLVVDEAQQVGAGIGHVAEMALRVRSRHRWCVTGTPLGPHGLDDLQGLLRVLHHDPLADERIFRRLLRDPFMRSERGSRERLAAALLPVMWRNTKEAAAAEVPLPPRQLRVAKLSLSEQERVFYSLVRDRGRQAREALRGAYHEAIAAAADAYDEAHGSSPVPAGMRLARVRHAESKQRASEAKYQLACQDAVLQERYSAIHPQLTHYWRTMGTQQLQASDGGAGMTEVMGTVRSNTQSELQARERELCTVLNFAASKMLALADARAAKAQGTPRKRKGEPSRAELDAKRARGPDAPRAHASQQGGSGSDDEGADAPNSPATLRARGPFFGLSPDELRRDARHYVEISYKVGDKGIGALDGEEGGDENISLDSGAIRAWRLLEVNTHAMLIRMLQPYAEGRAAETAEEGEAAAERLDKLRLDAEKKDKDYLWSADQELEQASEAHKAACEKVESLSRALKACWARCKAGPKIDWVVAGLEEGALGARGRAFDAALWERQVMEGVEKAAAEEEAWLASQEDQQIQSVLGHHVADFLEHQSSRVQSMRTALADAGFLRHEVKDCVRALPKTLLINSSSLPPTPCPPCPEKPPGLSVCHKILLGADLPAKPGGLSKGAAVAAAALYQHCDEQDKTFESYFIEKKCLRNFEKMLERIREPPGPLVPGGAKGADSGAVLPAVLVVKRCFDLLGALRDRHVKARGVVVKKWGRERAQELLQQAREETPNVPSQVRSSTGVQLVRRIEELKAKCRYLRHQYKYLGQVIGAGTEKPAAPADNAAGSQAQAQAQAGDSGGDDAHETCPSCLEPIDVRGKDVHMYPCGHRVCKDCNVKIWDNPALRGRCITCKRKARRGEIWAYKVGARSGKGGDGRAGGPDGGDECTDWPELRFVRFEPTAEAGTKLGAVVRRLTLLGKTRPDEKTLVFSQFPNALQLLGKLLTAAHIPHVSLLSSGGRQGHREEMLRFTQDPECRVFLLALRAGGVGLTLVQASNVILLEPATDPAIEQQAVARVHRIGQTRPVVVTRMLVRDTVEVPVLEMNRRKQGLAGHEEVGDGEEALAGTAALGGGEATTMAALAPTAEGMSAVDLEALLGE